MAFRIRQAGELVSTVLRVCQDKLNAIFTCCGLDVICGLVTLMKGESNIVK
jgi:hypothetical protein